MTHKLVVCEPLLLRGRNFLSRNTWPVSGLSSKIRVVRRHFVILPSHAHPRSNMCVGASKQDVTHKLVMCELLLLRGCHFLPLNIWPVSSYTAHHQSRETEYVEEKCEKIGFDFGLTMMNVEVWRTPKK